MKRLKLLGMRLRLRLSFFHLLFSCERGYPERAMNGEEFIDSQERGKGKRDDGRLYGFSEGLVRVKVIWSFRSNWS
ncbi:hypothetical protein B0T21DRAFT_361394 [Apiosordaria backusii]|uniref:Secreted protein n=1 Tax=Apiosordaria backusii TaxID=314023 RepID=A0AA40EN90_9PEZI|nr:hypothetical protein B0T21DRAFT_361394 [Apiosordaria backusii]